jgi:tetratricopeptide (TPR) repeat protein
MSMRYFPHHKLIVLLIWLFTSYPLCLKANDTAVVQSIIKKAVSATSDDERTRAFIKVSEIYAGSNLVKAAFYAKKALNSASRSNDNIVKESAYSNAITILAAAGNYEQAVHYMTLSMELSRKSGDKEAIAKSTFNLGSGWLILGNYARAEKLFENAYQMACRVSGSSLFLDTATHLLYLNNMGMIASETKNFNKAKDYYLEGLNQTQGKPFLIAEYAKFLVNYGDLQLKTKLPEVARVSFRKALHIYRQENDIPMQSLTLYSLAKSYENETVKDSAFYFFKMAYSMAITSGARSLQSDAALALTNLYQSLKMSDSALAYLQIHEDYTRQSNGEMTKDSLLSKEIAWIFQQKDEEYNATKSRLIWIITALVILASGIWIVLRKRKSQYKKAALISYQASLEKEKLLLEKELLEAELEKKDKQLTTEALYKIQKNAMIEEVVENLLKLRLESGQKTKTALNTVIRDLQKSMEIKVWTDFEMRFQQVHGHFYEVLDNRFPDLSTNERRLCAFLKLGLNTKEIATITGQTPNSITVARTRLRKKLNLDNTELALARFIESLD